MNYQDLIAKIAADFVPGVPKGINAEKLNGILNDIAQFANETRGDYQGTIGPSDDPGTPSTAVYYFSEGGGTYVYAGGLVIPDGLVIINFVPGTGWNFVAVPVDLGGYVLKTELPALIAPEVDLQNRSLEYTAGANQYEPVLKSDCIFRETASTFSGIGFAIGSPQGFDSIILRIRSRATPITQIRYTLHESSFSGALLVDVTKDVSLAANTVFDLLIKLPSVVANTADLNLYFFLRCNTFMDNYTIVSNLAFPVPPYEMGRYSVNGNLNGNGTEFSVAAGTRNAWFITSMVGTKLQQFPETVVVDKTKEQIKTLFGSQSDQAYLNSFLAAYGSLSETEIFEKSLASVIYNSSVFSGWSTPIGMPQNFNSIRFRVRARETTITSIRCRIRVGSTGATFADKTVTVNISPNQEADVVVVFDSVIANAGVEKLHFSWQSNQFAGLFGVAGSNVVFPESDGYDIPRYFTSGNQTTSDGSAPTTSLQERTWVIIANVTPIIGFSDALLNWIGDRLDVTQDSFTPSAVLLIPSQIYAAQGVENNIFWDNVIFANVPLSSLSINVTCNVGKQLGRGWRYTPGAETGSVSLTVQVSFDGDVLAQKTVTLLTQNSAGGAGSRKILCIGDSTTAGGQYISLINTAYGVNPSVTFLGTRGSGLNKHEGYGGYKFSTFVQAGVLTYRFNVSGVTIVPGIGSVYSHNGSNYTIAEVNMTGGAGYVAGTRSTGTADPLASGTLTKVSGTGDATVAFSSSEIISGNPFWIGGVLNFGQYLTNNSYILGAADLVTLHLGINDVFNDSGDANITAVIQNANTLINNIRAASGSVNIAICITIPPSISQDAFGENYSNGRTLDEYLVGYKKLVAAMFTEFDTPERRAAKIWVVPFNTGIDRTYNFPQTMVNVNARNTTQVTKWTNGVHPDVSGYNQMGDMLWTFVKNLA